MLFPLIALTVLPLLDSWGSPRAAAVVSENGRYAVAFEPRGSNGAEFSLFTQRPKEEIPSDAPLKAGVQQLLSTKEFDRPKLLGRMSVDQFPMQVLVSDEGHGFVALGRHYGDRTGKTVMTFDSEGQLAGSWAASDIERIGGRDDYSGTVSMIGWRRGGWIDEETGEAVMTSVHNQVFVAPLDRSELRLGGLPELKRALFQAGDLKQQMALDALALHDCPELTKDYVRLTAPTQPMATRLRAARALLATGDRSAGPLVMDVALRDRPGNGATLQDVTFALEDLHHYAGADVVLVLRERLRRLDPKPPGGALFEVSSDWVLLEPRTKALGRYGSVSAPLLVEMLQEPEAPLHYRRAAATALGDAGDTSSVDALLGATLDPDKRLMHIAFRSVVAIEGQNVAGRLVPMIGTRDALTGALIGYFSRFRHPDAESELKALLSTKEPAWLRERIEKAIRFQSHDG